MAFTSGNCLVIKAVFCAIAAVCSKVLPSGKSIKICISSLLSKGNNLSGTIRKTGKLAVIAKRLTKTIINIQAFLREAIKGPTNLR